MRRGFSLVEILVVISIMIMVMATLLPAIALWQKKSDLYATPNVIRAVHEAQYRNARQFGSAGLVYGYTIRGDRKGVQPWVLLPGAATVTGLRPEDIGRQMFWVNGYIEFTDNLEPKSAVDYSISFEPRTGMAYGDATVQPLSVVGDPGQTPPGGAIVLRSRRVPNADRLQLGIHPIGSIHVRGK